MEGAADKLLKASPTLKSSPTLKQPTAVSLEKMESLTALAFDPKKSKPGPKRNSLLVKQGFTNIKSKKVQMMSDPMS